MSKLFRPWMAVSFGVVFFSVPSFSQWASGMYPAMPACNYELQIGDEATDIKAELAERKEELSEAKSDLRKVKSRLSSVKSRVNSQRDLFKMSGFEGPAFNFIERHINAGSRCKDYEGHCEMNRYTSQNEPMERYPYWYFAYMLNERMKGNEEATVNFNGVFPNPHTQANTGTEVAAQDKGRPTRMPAADVAPVEPYPKNDDRVVPEPVDPPPVTGGGGGDACGGAGKIGYEGGFTAGTFLPHCVGTKIQVSICNIADGVDSIPRGRNPESCQKYLTNWQELKDEELELAAEKLRLEAIVKELEALTKLKKVELREAAKDYQREQRESMTEGGCLDCLINGGAVYSPPKPTIWETVGNFALAGLSIYGGMESSKYIADQNAKLGFQSTPMGLMGATANYGWPFIQAGLQGVLPGGIGAGGIGCAGSAFNGGQPMGPFGMAGPYGMNNPYGQMGFSPNSMWGMPNSMYGTPYGAGMFLPGAGPGFMPGYGQNNYCPAWPCPMNMNGMMGAGGMNPMMNGMMGMNPMMMGMNPMMNGMMNPMGMNGAMGMNPMMPGFLNPGASFGGMMNPTMNGMNPMMMGGMNPMMMNGMYNPYGMMSPMNPMGGMNTMGGAGGDPMMSYQMQQMQQQMQMQQYNMQMQMQMRNYQTQMAKQQALTGLYSEMNNLMMRIQQTQSQMSSGGMLGFDNSFAPTTGPGQVVIPGQIGTTPQPYPLPYNPSNPGTINPMGPPSYR